MADPARNAAPSRRPIPTRPVHKTGPKAGRPALYADFLEPEPLRALRMENLRWAGEQAFRFLFVAMVILCVVAVAWVRHGA